MLEELTRTMESDTGLNNLKMLVLWRIRNMKIDIGSWRVYAIGDNDNSYTYMSVEMIAWLSLTGWYLKPIIFKCLKSSFWQEIVKSTLHKEINKLTYLTKYINTQGGSCLS